MVLDKERERYVDDIDQLAENPMLGLDNLVANIAALPRQKQDGSNSKWG
jgi:hypothetical protein